MPEDEQFTGWGGERGPDRGDPHPQWRHPQGHGQGQGLPQFPRQTPPPLPEKGKAVKAALIFGPVVALLVFGALWVGGVIGDDPVPKDPVAVEHDWRTVPTIETTPDMSIKPGFRMGSTTKNVLNRVDSLPAAEACSIPRFVNTDQVAAERTVRAMVDCAARSWRPVLDRILEPRFIQDVDQVWTITEPKPYEFTCTMVALQDKSFYCPGEETGITIRADQQESVGDLLTTVTHEYGHHIQELAGIASGGYYRSPWHLHARNGRRTQPRTRGSRRRSPVYPQRAPRLATTGIASQLLRWHRGPRYRATVPRGRTGMDVDQYREPAGGRPSQPSERSAVVHHWLQRKVCRRLQHLGGPGRTDPVADTRKDRLRSVASRR